ncbi:MAG: hypothetical protein HY001_04140 [Candidatus Portnoybacteria bacterium]|nr:hypothetical protein [Candidatus Portnoybacteria bacterium]
MPEPTKQTPEALHERAKEIYEKKVTPEKGPEVELSEKEKELKEKIVEEAKTPPPPQVKDDFSKTVSDLLSLDDQAQLGELVKLVFTKDARFAIKVARAMQNPLVLDTFHDLLARDEMYYKLLKEKRL